MNTDTEEQPQKSQNVLHADQCVCVCVHIYSLCILERQGQTWLQEELTQQNYTA